MSIFSKIRKLFRRTGLKKFDSSKRWRYEKDGKTKYNV